MRFSLGIPFSLPTLKESRWSGRFSAILQTRGLSKKAGFVDGPGYFLPVRIFNADPVISKYSNCLKSLVESDSVRRDEIRSDSEHEQQINGGE
jgi:hypothetical protein